MADLSPAADAVLDAADPLLEQGGSPTWLIAKGVAAALRAAADQVLPDIGYEADCLNEPVESELQCVRTRFFAIAAELEHIND